jgi:hypothetical protein
MLKFIKSKKQKNAIAIAAMPKSASQRFLHGFEQFYDAEYKIVRGKISKGFGHNFLLKERIEFAADKNKGMAIYGHFPFNIHNEKVFDSLSAKKNAIVMIRSIPDAIVSYYDHVSNKGFGPLDYRATQFPEMNSLWDGLSESQRFEYILKFIAPWYVQFINSWCLAKQSDWNVFFVKFEDNIHDLPILLSEINRRFGLSERSQPNISSDEKKVNFNVGKNGRGKSRLSKNQLLEIELMLDLLIADKDIKHYLINGK